MAEGAEDAAVGLVAMAVPVWGGVADEEGAGEPQDVRNTPTIAKAIRI